MNREALTRREPAKQLLTAFAIVAALTIAVNYFLRVSNIGWRESKGYVQYYVEQHGLLNGVGWIAGATLVAWIALAVRARSRRNESSARKG